MKYPFLHSQKSSRQTVDVFRGYNHNLRIADGEFYDMENLTSDCYPVLSPRKKRGVYASPENPTGLIAKDALCYVDGTDFVMNEYRVDLGLSDSKKTLVSMGAYVIILPDRKWINTVNLSEHGSIDAESHTSGTVTFTLCTVEGAAYENTVTSPVEPTDNLAMWIDTSSTPHTLKQYSSSAGTWVQIPTTYIKIASPGIGAGFKQYDGVSISGATIPELNTSAVIWACDTDYIVVVGILDGVTTQSDPVTVARKMPDMDYITESGNRLWGCKYGMNDAGEVVNEIYASKLGDFKNWSCYMGISTDSYTASCGTDGRFTGAITHMGYPLFFKENCVHKVYGNFPANFQIQTTACRGVQRGCERSLAIVNEVLYYKSQSGVCAYDGSLPMEVSAVLGGVSYGNAVGGAWGNKYYISMEGDGRSLFVFDTAKGLWHREDDLPVEEFCVCRGELYAISEGNIITMRSADSQETVRWMAQTGQIGITSPDMKYVSRLTLRMSMDLDSTVEIYAMYDFNEEWEQLCSLQSTSLRSFSIPVRPKRCDHMKLKICGTGDAKVYSITKTIEQGSELS